MKRRMMRRKAWDDEGITSIVSDMLVLGITVSLFVALFAFVYNMPGPSENTFAEFESDLNLDVAGGWVNLTHCSGETLMGHRTRIYLYKNLYEEVIPLGTKGVEGGEPYGIDSLDENWDVGETWKYYWEGISSKDKLEGRIIDEQSNSLVWLCNLLDTSLNFAPIIMERWHSKPASMGGYVRLYANVIDSNGRDDIESVWANVSVLNDTIGTIFFTDEDQDGTYLTPQFKIEIGEGSYLLTVTAKDKSNFLDSARLIVDVESIFADVPIIIYGIAEPNPVDPYESAQFEVRACIWDPQGNDNIDKDQVKVDLTNMGQSVQVMSESPVNSGVFRYTATTPSLKGDYIVNLSAKDVDNNAAENYTLHLHVIEDAIGETQPSEDWSIPKKIWDYIGFAQLDIDDIFWTHAGEWPEQGGEGPSHYHPIYRINDKHIQQSINGHKSMIWHVIVNNHGNRTIYLDSYTTLRWQEGTSSKWRFIIANDTSSYPHTGGAGQEGDIFGFAFDADYVIDINKASQEQGGPQLDIKFGAKSIGDNDFGDAGSTGSGNNPHPIFISLSGILGPMNKSVAEILDHYGYENISQYHPENHIDDSEPEWRTKWFGQLIPFLSVWVFSQGGAGEEENSSYPWPPPQPDWYEE